MAAIITNVGLAKLATASPLDPLQITHVAFGDGVNPLDATSTALVNEVYRSVASDPIKTDADPSILIFEGSVPGNVGGFTLREMGLFDVDGDLIAIGDINNIVKPLPSTGNQIILTQRLHVKFSNTSDVDLIAQDVAIFDHQGLSNRSATEAHPATSINTSALSDIGLGVSTVQGVLGELKSAALRAIGTSSGNVPDKAVLDTRFGEGNNVMVGGVVFFASTTTPLGYIKANGAAVSRTTYANLFTMIGTVFGAGNGSTTFNVPDLRGEFIRGWDDGRGVDAGRVFGSAQSSEFGSHAHALPEGGADYAVYGTTVDTNLQVEDFSTSITTTVRSLTDTAGGVETRPRNVALTAYIKY